jgi:hypothetical protein
MRCGSDGSGLTTIWNTSVGQPWPPSSISTDDSGSLFWLDGLDSSFKIRTAKFDGSGVRTLFDARWMDGNSNNAPQMVAAPDAATNEVLLLLTMNSQQYSDLVSVTKDGARRSRYAMAPYNSIFALVPDGRGGIIFLDEVSARH